MGDRSRNAEVASIMKSGQPAINEFMIESLMDIKEQCAKNSCTVKKPRVHPAISTSFIATIVVGILEGIKAMGTHK